MACVDGWFEIGGGKRIDTPSPSIHGVVRLGRTRFPADVTIPPTQRPKARLAAASAGKLWSNRNMVSRIRGVFVFAILGLCLALATAGCAKKDDAAQKRERDVRKQR